MRYVFCLFIPAIVLYNFSEKCLCKEVQATKNASNTWGENLFIREKRGLKLQKFSNLVKGRGWTTKAARAAAEEVKHIGKPVKPVSTNKPGLLTRLNDPKQHSVAAKVLNKVSISNFYNKPGLYEAIGHFEHDSTFKDRQLEYKTGELYAVLKTTFKAGWYKSKLLQERDFSNTGYIHKSNLRRLSNEEIVARGLKQTDGTGKEIEPKYDPMNTFGGYKKLIWYFATNKSQQESNLYDQELQNFELPNAFRWKDWKKYVELVISVPEDVDKAEQEMRDAHPDAEDPEEMEEETVFEKEIFPSESIQDAEKDIYQDLYSDSGESIYYDAIQDEETHQIRLPQVYIDLEMVPDDREEMKHEKAIYEETEPPWPKHIQRFFQKLIVDLGLAPSAELGHLPDDQDKKVQGRRGIYLAEKYLLWFMRAVAREVHLLTRMSEDEFKRNYPNRDDKEYLGTSLSPGKFHPCLDRSHLHENVCENMIKRKVLDYLVLEFGNLKKKLEFVIKYGKAFKSGQLYQEYGPAFWVKKEEDYVEMLKAASKHYYKTLKDDSAEQQRKTLPRRYWKGLRHLAYYYSTLDPIPRFAHRPEAPFHFYRWYLGIWEMVQLATRHSLDVNLADSGNTLGQLFQLGHNPTIHNRESILLYDPYKVQKPLFHSEFVDFIKFMKGPYTKAYFDLRSKEMPNKNKNWKRVFKKANKDKVEQELSKPINGDSDFATVFVIQEAILQLLTPLAKEIFLISVMDDHLFQREYQEVVDTVQKLMKSDDEESILEIDNPFDTKWKSYYSDGSDKFLKRETMLQFLYEAFENLHDWRLQLIVWCQKNAMPAEKDLIEFWHNREIDLNDSYSEARRNWEEKADLRKSWAQETRVWWEMEADIKKMNWFFRLVVDGVLLTKYAVDDPQKFVKKWRSMFTEEKQRDPFRVIDADEVKKMMFYQLYSKKHIKEYPEFMTTALNGKPFQYFHWRAFLEKVIIFDENTGKITVELTKVSPPDYMMHQYVEMEIADVRRLISHLVVKPDQVVFKDRMAYGFAFRIWYNILIAIAHEVNRVIRDPEVRLHEAHKYERREPPLKLGTVGIVTSSEEYTNQHKDKAQWDGAETHQEIYLRKLIDEYRHIKRRLRIVTAIALYSDTYYLHKWYNRNQEQLRFDAKALKYWRHFPLKREKLNKDLKFAFWNVPSPEEKATNWFMYNIGKHITEGYHSVGNKISPAKKKFYSFLSRHFCEISEEERRNKVSINMHYIKKNGDPINHYLHINKQDFANLSKAEAMALLKKKLHGELRNHPEIKGNAGGRVDFTTNYGEAENDYVTIMAAIMDRDIEKDTFKQKMKRMSHLGGTPKAATHRDLMHIVFYYSSFQTSQIHGISTGHETFRFRDWHQQIWNLIDQATSHTLVCHNGSGRHTAQLCHIQNGTTNAAQSAKILEFLAINFYKYHQEYEEGMKKHNAQLSSDHDPKPVAHRDETNFLTIYVIQRMMSDILCQISHEIIRIRNMTDDKVMEDYAPPYNLDKYETADIFEPIMEGANSRDEESSYLLLVFEKMHLRRLKLMDWAIDNVPKNHEKTLGKFWVEKKEQFHTEFADADKYWKKTEKARKHWPQAEQDFWNRKKELQNKPLTDKELEETKATLREFYKATFDEEKVDDPCKNNKKVWKKEFWKRCAMAHLLKYRHEVFGISFGLLNKTFGSFLRLMMKYIEKIHHTRKDRNRRDQKEEAGLRNLAERMKQVLPFKKVLSYMVQRYYRNTWINFGMVLVFGVLKICTKYLMFEPKTGVGFEFLAIDLIMMFVNPEIRRNAVAKWCNYLGEDNYAAQYMDVFVKAYAHLGIAGSSEEMQNGHSEGKAQDGAHQEIKP